MPLSLLIDEDTRDGALWNAITRHNATSPGWAIDAVRVGDEGAPRLGTLDPDVVAWAIQAKRIILSRDVSTLIAEHWAVVDAGKWTPGLLILKKGYALPDVVEYLSLLCHVASTEEFACQCRYIPDE